MRGTPHAAEKKNTNAPVAWRQHVKHLFHRFGRAQEAVHAGVVLPPRLLVQTQLAPRHHVVRKAPHLLRLGERGADALVAHQRLHHVAKERLPVARVAT